MSIAPQISTFDVRIRNALNRGMEARHALLKTIKAEEEGALRTGIPSEFLQALETAGITPDNLDTIELHKFESADQNFLGSIKADEVNPTLHDRIIAFRQKQINPLGDIAQERLIREPGLLSKLPQDSWIRQQHEEFLSRTSQHVPQGRTFEEAAKSAAAGFDSELKAAPEKFAQYKEAFAVLHSKGIEAENAVEAAKTAMWNAMDPASQAARDLSSFRETGADYITELPKMMEGTHWSPEAKAKGAAFVDALKAEQFVRQEMTDARNRLGFSSTVAPHMQHPEHGLVPAHEYANLIESEAGGIAMKRVDMRPPAEAMANVGNAALGMERAAENISKAGAEAEKAASKMSGKTKWIIGGVAAATVALGAALLLNKKKSHVEREEDRRRDNAAVQAIG